MTIQEYKRISKADFRLFFGYDKYHYYNLRKQEYTQKIKEMEAKRPGIPIVLHHIDMGCNDYELWNCIPMYEDEHILLHQNNGTVYKKGRVESDELKARRSSSLKGSKKPQHWIDQVKIWAKKKPDNFSEICSKGQTKRFSDPIEKAKLSSMSIGKVWWNNGIIETRALSCPEGYTRGRLAGVVKGHSAAKGKRHYTNGIIETMAFECPEGFRPGRLIK